MRQNVKPDTHTTSKGQQKAYSPILITFLTLSVMLFMYDERIGNNNQAVGLLLALLSCVGVWFYVMTHVKKTFTYKGIRMAWLSGYV